MQTTQLITRDGIGELLTCIFASGAPIVREAYSEFGRCTRAFPTLQSLRENIILGLEQGKTFFHYAIYYPEAKGFVLERRIELKPGAVKSHTHRFSQEGWGLIFLQITLKGPAVVECRIAVNSETRANNWQDTLDRLKEPALWNWEVVNRYGGRLTRLVRKLAKQQAEPQK